MPRVEIRPSLFFTFLIKQQDGDTYGRSFAWKTSIIWCYSRRHQRPRAFFQQVLGMTPFTFGNGRTAPKFGNRKITFMKWARGFPQAYTLFRARRICVLPFRTLAVEMLDHLKANGVPVEEWGRCGEGALGPITSV